MGCWKMSNMEFLDPLEAEKFNKQKWKQFWWTPCNTKDMIHRILRGVLSFGQFGISKGTGQRLMVTDSVTELVSSEPVTRDAYASKHLKSEQWLFLLGNPNSTKFLFHHNYDCIAIVIMIRICKF